MLFISCCRAFFHQRHFLALFLSLALATAALAAPAPALPSPPDSTLTSLPAPAPGLAADTVRLPVPSVTLVADSARPRRARKSDYTVAPGVTWHFEKPKPFRWLLHVPRDLMQYPGYAFRKENTGAIVGVGLSSVALWVADEVLLDWSQDFGKAIGLEAKSTQKTLVYIPFSIGSLNLPLEFNVPDNLNSTFYFIGDGWTHLTTAASFMAYGIIKKDNRAAQTATQIGESILSTGIVVQAIKRSTGRQSPFVATKPRGEWHLFPSISRYQSFVPNYDAYPTGHMATAMATVTVIADNYPEYKFVRPIGYSLIGLLGYSMLNNGVHWASDYPLGIALGYGFAKIAVRQGRTRVEAPAEPGTGFVPRRPQPWHRRLEYTPFNYGPYAGMSCTYRW